MRRDRSEVSRLPHIFLGVGAAALLLVAGCGGGGDSAATAAGTAEEAAAPVPVTETMLARGAEIYASTCAPCHGPTGRGDGPAAEHLDPKPRDHSNGDYMNTLADQEIRDVVRLGGAIRGYPNMPSNPHLHGDELDALVAYVRTLSRGHDAMLGAHLDPRQ